MEQLFGSKTRVKLLGLFFKNPNRAYYVREITRKIDEQINSVRRELANLLSIGILKSNNRNNRLYYEVDQTYESYDALKALFTNSKTSEGSTGDSDFLQSIKGLGSVDVLIYMGSFTQDTVTGIDMLVIGDVNKTQVHNFVADLEDEEGREIKYVVMPTAEFMYRRDVNDRFISQVDAAKKSVVHDPKGLMITKKTTKKKK